MYLQDLAEADAVKEQIQGVQVHMEGLGVCGGGGGVVWGKG
jgi:hypothetical protein